jgi:F-box and WD-40 domain protein CDC4
MMLNFKRSKAPAVSSIEPYKATQAPVNRPSKKPAQETALRDVEIETTVRLPYDQQAPPLFAANTSLSPENRDIVPAPGPPRTVHTVLIPTRTCDFLTLLSPGLVSHILSFMPFNCIARASRVSKSWRDIIVSQPVLWRDLLKSENLWFGGDSERAFTEALIRRRQRAGLSHSNDLSLPEPYKVLFKSRYLTRTRWINNPQPKHLTFPAHGRSIVTCLLLSKGRIISASDDHSIHVYSPVSGLLLHSLSGHEGGVWALAVTKDTLVSGSTDRTVRIWDLSNGRCTHVFGGHTSTVRCLTIVKPEWVDVEDEHGNVRMEKWPKRALIVSGSRDHSLRVCNLPRPNEPGYTFDGADEADCDPDDVRHFFTVNKFPWTD